MKTVVLLLVLVVIIATLGAIYGPRIAANGERSLAIGTQKIEAELAKSK